MTAEVRALTPQDVPAVLALVEAYWQFEGVAGFDANRLARPLGRLLSEPALGAGWLACEHGAPVGYLLAVWVFSLEHGGLTAEIDEFFVLPSLRGRRIGERLLHAAEAEFARRGCTNASLQLGRGNDRARAFYRAHGYAERAGYELLDKALPVRQVE